MTGSTSSSESTVPIAVTFDRGYLLQSAVLMESGADKDKIIRFRLGDRKVVSFPKEKL
ncbi:MAG: hypothetical protein IIY88_06720 [Eubacterium sp.]|nr:hypothetical protein [Eubacterium sp.]